MRKIGRFILFFLISASLTTHVFGQPKNAGIEPELKIQQRLSDPQLLDLVQKQTFRYFWDFVHPVSGMARERSNMDLPGGNDIVTTGGTGFGIMGIVVAVDRKWINRDTAVRMLLKMTQFLEQAEAYHGVFPHWLNGATGKTIPFSKKDNGADLVETSFLFQGLLTVKQYFNNNSPSETELRKRIIDLWDRVEWNWFTQGGQDVLYWHWSPNYGWEMNLPLKGYNECLITYVLAASAIKHSISASVYHKGWASGKYFINNKTFYGYKLPLGVNNGGPLFFSQYSFLGLDPRKLKDKYADYWEQNKNHTLINRAYVVANPKNYKGYGANCWGLTASDSWQGYAAHSPEEDLGVISPTAALSAFPYTPKFSMQVLKHFYFDLGDHLWSEYGFVDAFSEAHNWYAKSHLAIDQGPIIVMIENYRSGLLWKLFMSNPEVKSGLKKLGFKSPLLKE
ncbi:hypothetical protein ACVWYN_003710 [Pedobacter sp. UYP24]